MTPFKVALLEHDYTSIGTPTWNARWRWQRATHLNTNAKP